MYIFLESIEYNTKTEAYFLCVCSAWFLAVYVSDGPLSTSGPGTRASSLPQKHDISWEQYYVAVIFRKIFHFLLQKKS